MDINTLRGISTIFVMLAFLSIFVWVYIIRSKKHFDEAANLPFADDEQPDFKSDQPEKSL